MSIEITKNIEMTIQVQEHNKARCDDRCWHITKERGMYQCKLFYETVDGYGDDVDGCSHYGFVRCDECINKFGEATIEEANNLRSKYNETK